MAQHEPTAAERREALRQTVAALDMPPRGVAVWLEHLAAFGRAHGGARHYAELLALVERCREALGPCA